MALEVVRGGHHVTHGHSRAGRWPAPYDNYSEPYAVAINHIEHVKPWRVTLTTSWGTNVVFSSSTVGPALTYFRTAKPMGFNNGLKLQQWTGAEWITHANRSVTNGRG